MASGWFGGRAIELVRARSLFVKVLPTPANLLERRAVLHALKRYGQIEIFKRLPNPETFVCAPTKSEVASELISRSPLSFKLISETFDSIEAKSFPGISSVGVAPPIEIHEENAKPPSPGEQAQSDLVRSFTLYINPSQSYYEHKTNIRLSPIHGPWPKTARQDQDSVYFALQGAVPNDMAREGLCDWHTGSQLSGEPASIRAQNAHSKLWHIRERQMRRRKSREMEEDEDSALVAMKSLDVKPGQPAAREGAHETAPGDLGEMKPRGPRKQTVSDPFEEMERQVLREGTRKLAPKKKDPAWLRRRQVKLNPLADGKHYKIDKKVPVSDLEGGFDFKPLQLDNAKRSTEHQQDDGKK